MGEKGIRGKYNAQCPTVPTPPLALTPAAHISPLSPPLAAATVIACTTTRTRDEEKTRVQDRVSVGVHEITEGKLVVKFEFLFVSPGQVDWRVAQFVRQQTQ